MATMIPGMTLGTDGGGQASLLEHTIGPHGAIITITSTPTTQAYTTTITTIHTIIMPIMLIPHVTEAA